jgi:X-X-X-Leu-X-X-Gly heptad repeat protein
LTDGTTVLADGTVKMKDGTTATMQEGDYFKMDGTKGNMKMKQNSMSNKMQTDTAK